MIGCFPTPHPDELLYSLCARFCDRMQYPSRRSIVQDLFNSATAIAIVDLPCRLNDLMAALPPEYPYTVEQLVDGHTLLPFYGPFLPAERLSELREAMCRQDGTGIHMRMGLIASTVPLTEWLRFCPKCVEEDRERCGERYWHRIHQVPGVEVCPTHGLALMDSAVRARGGKPQYDFVSAERALPELPAAAGPLPSQEVLLAVAQEALWLLGHPQLVAGPGVLHERYLHWLVARGLSTHAGRVRMRKLRVAFSAHYPVGLLQALHCDLAEDLGGDWLARLIRTPDKSQHPLHHILLSHFLGLSLEQLFEEPVVSSPFGEGPWPCLNPACEHYRQPAIAECQVAYSRYTGDRPVGTFACSCGFVYRRTGPDLVPGDCFRVGKISTFGPLWEGALRRRWNDFTTSLEQIARYLGVDPVTVKSHAERLGLAFPRPGKRDIKCRESRRPALEDNSSTCSLLATHRSKWLAALEEDPEAGVKAVRGRVPGTYAWLYRHDREWLKAHTPSRQERAGAGPQHVNWKERDRMLAEAVRGSAQRLKNAPGRPVRVTITAIGKDIGQQALLQKHLGKLPLTLRTLAEVSESREDAAVRRVWWAAERFQKEGACPKRWQLVKRAGVGRLVARRRVVAETDAALLLLTQEGFPG